MSDDEIPELEDMSHLQDKKIDEKKAAKEEKSTDYTLTTDDLQKKREKDSNQLDKNMAKGFKGLSLYDDKPSQKFDVKKAPSKDGRVLSEVQEAMDKQPSVSNYLTQNKDKWMTEGLLGKVQGNEGLLKGLADPEIMAAVGLMQTNPTQAKQKFKDNKKVTDFFVEFSKLMGGHFEELGEKEKDEKKEEQKKEIKQPPKPSIEEIKPVSSKPIASKKQQPPPVSSPDPQMAKKLEDPTVQHLLSLPKIQAFIAELQKGRPLDLREVMHRDPEMGQQLLFLVNKGVFNINA